MPWPSASGLGGLDIFGFYETYYASFIAMLLGPVVYIPIMIATRGRY
ncbi:MAG: hypothetical protein WDA07_01865 [Leucobacter sp.]